MQIVKHPSSILIVIFALTAMALIALAGEGDIAVETVDSGAADTAMSPAPESILPDVIVNYAEPRTIEAYMFAVEHPDLLEHQPCYCGCNMIHTSNRACYIQEVGEDGSITFDMHAFGCGICVDITLDVKRLTEAGWSQLDIRQYIDETYSAYGPSTDTAMPEG